MKYSIRTLLLLPLALSPLLLVMHPPAFSTLPGLFTSIVLLYVSYVSLASSYILVGKLRRGFNSLRIVSAGLRIGSIAGIACFGMLMSPMLMTTSKTEPIPITSVIIGIILFGAASGSLIGAATAFLIDIGLAFFKPTLWRSLRSNPPSDKP